MARPNRIPSRRIRLKRASLGGRARAKVLSPRRRSEIAKLGWLTRQAISHARKKIDSSEEKE